MRIQLTDAMTTIDPDKIDEAVLALLLLGRHDEMRVWKGHDWKALDRLHQKGSSRTL